MTSRDELLRSAPSTAAAQAALELGLPGDFATLPRDVRTFKQGGVSRAATVARKTTDVSELLLLAEKDRRKTVLTEILNNPSATQDVILAAFRRAHALGLADLLTPALQVLKGPSLGAAMRELDRPAFSPIVPLCSTKLVERVLAGEEDVLMQAVSADFKPVLALIQDTSLFFTTPNVDPSVLARVAGKVPARYTLPLLFILVSATAGDVPEGPFTSVVAAVEGEQAHYTRYSASAFRLSPANQRTCMESSHKCLQWLGTQSQVIDEHVFAEHIDLFFSQTSLGGASWEWTPVMAKAVLDLCEERGTSEPYQRVQPSLTKDSFRGLPGEVIARLLGYPAFHRQHLADYAAGLMGVAPKGADFLPRVPDWGVTAEFVHGYGSYANQRPDDPEVIATCGALYPLCLEAGHDVPAIAGGYVAHRLGDNVEAWKLLHSLADEGEQGLGLPELCDAALALSEAS